MLRTLWDFLLLKVVSPINWQPLKSLTNGGVYWSLLEADLDHIRKLLADHYFIILNRRNSHLTTYLIQLASWWKSGKQAHWAHALMNIEGDDPRADEDFRLQEATRVGVHYSTFMQVFDCDCVALLVPKGFTPAEWTEVMDGLKSENGRAYDTLFDLSSAEQVSCIEMVRVALQKLPDYAQRFPKLEAMIQAAGNLTPQMAYDCGEFDVFLEIHRGHKS